MRAPPRRRADGGDHGVTLSPGDKRRLRPDAAQADARAGVRPGSCGLVRRPALRLGCCEGRTAIPVLRSRIGRGATRLVTAVGRSRMIAAANRSWRVDRRAAEPADPHHRDAVTTRAAATTGSPRPHDADGIGRTGSQTRHGAPVGASSCDELSRRVYHGDSARSPPGCVRAAPADLAYPNGTTVDYLAPVPAPRQFGLYRWNMAPGPGGPTCTSTARSARRSSSSPARSSLGDGAKTVPRTPGDHLYVPPAACTASRTTPTSRRRCCCCSRRARRVRATSRGCSSSQGKKMTRRSSAFFVAHDNIYVDRDALGSRAS